MNIQRLNSTPFSNGAAFRAGIQELVAPMGLEFIENDGETHSNGGFDLCFSENKKVGINFKGEEGWIAVHLFNSNYLSDNADIMPNLSGAYVFYAFSEDGKTLSLGFSDNISIPKMFIFITSALNLKTNEEIKVFGSTGTKNPFNYCSVIVSDNFYIERPYIQNITLDSSLVELTPMVTILESEPYKLHNIYIPIIFTNTIGTTEFKLNDKYYISSQIGGSNYPRWIMQI